MKVARHIVEARRQSIASLVREHGYLPILTISRQFRISPATARRDLDELVSQKVLTRTHGGALSDYNREFASAGQRRRVDAVAKRAIGVAGSEMIQPGMTVYIDAGTTPLAVASALAARRIPGVCVVTANLAVAQLLGDIPEITVHMTAGHYLGRQEMLAGPEVARSLRAWQFDLAFVGCEGLDAAGLHNSQADVVAVTHALRDVGKRLVVCTTRSKVGVRAPVLVSETLNGFTLITDATRAELSKARVPLGSATHIKV
ncbi:MAG: DeoR/GlpR family DNA-binding transcription regulator [Opitutales bacterium]